MFYADDDPNTWDCWTPTTHRIWGDNQEHIHAIVDEIDYLWAIRWLWSPKVSRGGKKIYLFRCLSQWIGGVPTKQSLYLHVEIMKRKNVLQPTPLHTIADHRDGNGLNCVRDNLRWATPKMNRRNLFGAYPHDLIEG